MLNKPNNFDSVSTETYKQLPKGAYTSRILGVAIKNIKGIDYLEVSTDIVMGDYKDFWAKEYRNQKSNDKYWHSNILYRIPDDNCEEWVTRNFKRFIEAIEDSNNGYHFDWNEQTLKNKMCGGVYILKERLYNGKKYTSTILGSICSVGDVANGTYWTPEDRLLPNAEPAPQTTQTESLDMFDSSTLPF